MDLRPIPEGELETWYETELSEAFPPHERKPLSDILVPLARGDYALLGPYDGETRLGFAGLWSNPAHPRAVLLDYLGVPARRRNGGLGEQILQKLGERFAGRAVIIAEAELPGPGASQPENDLRRRRIGFYRRNGFRPVYRSAGCGLALQTLALGQVEDLDALMAAHRAIYGPGRPDIHVPLEPGTELEPPHWMKGG